MRWREKRMLFAKEKNGNSSPSVAVEKHSQFLQDFRFEINKEND